MCTLIPAVYPLLLPRIDHEEALFRLEERQLRIYPIITRAAVSTDTEVLMFTVV